jgi:hypothetical protein
VSLLIISLTRPSAFARRARRFALVEALEHAAEHVAVARVPFEFVLREQARLVQALNDEFHCGGEVQRVALNRQMLARDLFEALDLTQQLEQLGRWRLVADFDGWFFHARKN